MSETKCNSLPSYEDQRKELMEKINTTYESIFSNYQQLSTTNERDNLPIQKQEEKLEDLTEDLLNQLQRSVGIIIEQHKILEDKNEEYKKNKQNIAKHEQDIKDFSNSKKAREDSHLSTLQDVKNLKFRHNVYLVINVLLLLVSVGLLVYVYRK
tara:strand:- start:540 stop:1001 length:462 start_codon:yes stop_codon:yes gene_type:complete